MDTARRRPLAVDVVLLALTYAAVAKLVDEVTAFGNTTGATFWPGAGLTLAALVKHRAADWPWLLAGVLLAEVAVDLWVGFPADVAVAWGFANTLEPLAGAALLRLAERRAAVHAPDSFMRFVCCCVVAGPVIGSVVGTAAGALLAGDPWWPRLGRWYIGDAIGVLVVAPALVTPRVGPATFGRGRGLVSVAILGLALVLLGPWPLPADAGLPFLVMPALVLVALSYGAPGAALAVVAVAAVVETVTAAGRGPFAADGPFEGLVPAQLFLGAAAVTSQIVAALSADLVRRARREAALHAQTLHDGLTGVANRRLLLDRLDVASRRLARQGGVVAVLFVDLDRFKDVNDTLGHHAGDAVLVEVARRLTGVVRSGDTVARVGGDEFVVLGDTVADEVDAQRLAHRVLSVLSAPVAWREHRVDVRASVGLAVARGPVTDPEGFVAAADAAMYAAKQGGGGVRVAPDEAVDVVVDLRAEPADR